MRHTLARLAVAGVTLLSLASVAQALPAATMAQVDKAAGHKVVTGDKVKFITTKGSFEVVLFPKEAPKTVANFEALVKKGFYNGTTFHRVIPGFMAQGGDPLSKKLPPGNPQIGTGGSGHNIPDEFSPHLKHLTGTLAMAHASMPNSASSQFYICFAPAPFLDGQYTIFGQVIQGMNVVNKIQPTERNNMPLANVKPDRILKAEIVK